MFNCLTLEGKLAGSRYCILLNGINLKYKINSKRFAKQKKKSKNEKNIQTAAVKHWKTTFKRNKV